MRKMLCRTSGRFGFVAAILTALAVAPAFAQESGTPGEAPAEAPLDLDALDPAIDWSALDFDAASLAGAGARKKPTVVVTPRADTTRWNRTDNRDGSAAITAARPLPTPWDTKVGVDFALSAPSSPLPSSSDQSGSGVAWTRTTAPGLGLPLGWDKALIETRLDPMQDQSKIGTRFSKSLPLGNEMSVTMESGFALTHLRSQPLPHDMAGNQPFNVFDAEGVAKLNVLATGTSIGAGSRRSTVDETLLNSLSAEQKLFGGLSVTGTLSETAEGPTSKSLTAGFRRTW
jgi:hypothetical protein